MFKIMKKYLIIFFITILIILTTLIKTSTRELETDIFNSEEKIKILLDKKELIQLQNSYLSSPERLFELKDKFFSKDFRFLEFKQFIYLSHDAK